MKVFLLLLLFVVNQAFAMTYQEASLAFENLTKPRIDKIKEGSKPFMLGQGKKTKTVIMFHGLSDSPGSMVELSQVYFKQGYNVITILLRDHGLVQEFRDDARSKVKLEHWREDIDAIMKIGFELSDSDKVAVAGYSLGGALVIDTANRYENRISSIVMIAPMFKMMYSALTPLTKFLKHFVYATQKGIAEMPHFYPDIALNQTFYASKLTRYLKHKVTRKPKDSLLSIPKVMFLTDADTTIINKFALKTAERINVNHIYMYENKDAEKIVLHRDLPIRKINANGNENPHLDDLLSKVDSFLTELE